MRAFLLGVRSQKALPEDFSNRAGTGDWRDWIYSSHGVLMIGIMKDGAFHWRFNDTENKLKASTLPVRVLRDSRQIFVQCRERKKRNHPKSTTQTKQKKRRKKKGGGKKSSWTSTVPWFSGALCCLFKRRTCTVTQMGYLMRCSSNEGLSF